MKVSVIIPSRNERHLSKTIKDVLEKATGEIEVIAVLDGHTDYPLPAEHPYLRVIQKDSPEGMRSAINTGVDFAKGKFIMKVDGHVALSEGFDEVLQADCADNWIVSARRFNLVTDTWDKDTKEPVDYFYYACPWNNSQHYILQSCPWVSRTRERTEISLDEQMTIHGAMWFTEKQFYDRIGRMTNEGWGGFAGEPMELGFKTWLGPWSGKMMVNKNVWYAHPRESTAGYSVRSTGMMEGLIYSSHYWVENKWEGRVQDFNWLVKKFWPLPTTKHHCNAEKYLWPEDYDRTL